MEDINSLNYKLQSISKKLEDIQSSVLIQEENIRKYTRERHSAVETKITLNERLMEQSKLMEQEKEAFVSVLNITCRLEIENNSADFSLGQIPSFVLKTCNDYEKYSARINSQIRAKCQILQDNYFWITKQKQADAEHEEFKRTLRETIVNRSAFSYSEEERLRNQLEVEETRLAFLNQQISELEQEPPVPPPTPRATHHTRNATPPRPSPTTSFPQTASVASRVDHHVANGATSHSRAFVTPSVVTTSSRFTPPHASQSTSHGRGEFVDQNDPFEGWAERSSPAPEQQSTFSSPYTQQHSPSPRTSKHNQGTKPTRSEQSHDDFDRASPSRVHRPYTDAPPRRDNTDVVEVDTALSDVDYELDCTSAAQRQRGWQHEQDTGDSSVFGGHMQTSQPGRVELTAVSRITITEVTVQQEFVPPAAPPVYAGGPGEQWDPCRQHHHSSRNTPYDTPYSHHESPYRHSTRAGYGQDEVPWFREHKRKRTLGQPPPAVGYGYGGSSGGGYPLAYQQTQGHTQGQSSLPPRPPLQPSAPLWPAQHQQPHAPSHYTPPLWPPSRDGDRNRPATTSNADHLYQRSPGRAVSSADMSPSGVSNRRDTSPPSRRMLPVAAVQQPEVIDLYEASDSDSSDPGTALLADHHSPASHTLQHPGVASTGGARSRERTRELRSHPDAAALKDRFRTGLDMLQYTTHGKDSNTGNAERGADYSLVEIDM